MATPALTLVPAGNEEKASKKPAGHTVQGVEGRRRQLVKEGKLHCWVLPASVPSGQDLKHPSVTVRTPSAPEISRLALANPAGENRKIYCEYRTCPR